MSGEKRRTFMESLGIFFNGYILGNEGVNLPMNYADQLTRSYDVYDAVHDELTGGSKLLVESELEKTVGQMKGFCTALKTAQLLSRKDLQEAITGLEERIKHYESSNGARESQS